MSELFGPVTPVLLIALIAALVQFIKTQFKLEGTIVVWISFGVGVLLGSVFMAAEVWPVTAIYLRWFVYALLFGFVASGFYDLTKRKEQPVS